MDRIETNEWNEGRMRKTKCYYATYLDNSSSKGLLRASNNIIDTYSNLIQAD
jgi:hypothetical protein